MSARANIFVGRTLAVVVLLGASFSFGAAPTRASSVSLPDATYYATVAYSSAAAGGSQDFNTLGSHQVVYPQFSSTTVTFKDQPSPSIYASVAINSVPQAEASGASLFSHLTYYFSVSGPEGVLVPVQIQGAAGYKFRANGGGGSITFADARLDVTDLGNPPLVIGPHTIAEVAYQVPSWPHDLTYSESYGVVANHLYSLDLTAEIAAGTYGSFGGQGLSVAVWIDPVLSISTPGYQLQLSPGVGNAFASTPIPATLPLFASALGGLGFVGWRRKASPELSSGPRFSLIHRHPTIGEATNAAL